MTTRYIIDRRQFLQASSVCTVAALTFGPRLIAAVAPPRRLTVGFVPLDAAGDVVAAAAVTASDGSFISRGARISVSGATAGAVAAEDRRAVELVTHFSYLDGAERKTAPFRAWSFSRTNGHQSPPISFTVPVDEAQQISLSIETAEQKPAAALSRRAAMTGAATAGHSLPLTFALHSGEGITLTRGFYVIVPLYDNDHAPAWPAYELKVADGRWALHDREGRVAPFEHLVLKIDYAS